MLNEYALPTFKDLQLFFCDWIGLLEERKVRPALL